MTKKNLTKNQWRRNKRNNSRGKSSGNKPNWLMKKKFSLMRKRRTTPCKKEKGKKIRLILLFSFKKVTLKKYLTFFPGRQRAKMTRMQKLRKMNKKIRLQTHSIFLDLGANLKMIFYKHQKPKNIPRGVILCKRILGMMIRNKI